MKAAIALVVMGASARIAAAGPLADAIAHHKDADIAALRGHLADHGDLAGRCALASAYAARGDLPRAALFFAGCDGEGVQLPADIAPQIAKLARDLPKKLLAADLGSVEIVSTPPGLVAEIDALPGEQIELPATLWLPPGSYVARVAVADVVLSNSIVTRAHSRGTSMFEAPVASSKKDPDAPAQVDFTTDGGAEAVEQQTAPPPDLKHPPLMGDRYRGITTATGPQIEDPLEHGIPGGDRGPRGWSIGARIGGGMFDDSLATARAGLDVAAVGRVRIADRIVLDGRLDWSRRGTSAIDTVGVTPAIGAILATTSIGALAASIGPRLDVRLESAANGMTVSRTGVSGVAGLDLAIANTPLSAGVRYERGLTAQVPGAHDSAIIVELGVDWR